MESVVVDGEKYGVIYGAIYPTSYGTNYMFVQMTFVYASRGCTEVRGPADRVPRLGEFLGPRTASRRISWTAYRVSARSSVPRTADLLDRVPRSGLGGPR